MTAAQLAAVSFLARYTGQTHRMYAFQLRRWFAWCDLNALDPLSGVQRARVELFIRYLGECGLVASSVNTSMHAVRGFFKFAHIDGLIISDPAVYARLPKVHSDESRTQGLDRLELIRFLQVAADHHRPPRRTGLPARHQRPSSLGSRCCSYRGLPGDLAWAPGSPPRRQGEQTGDHACDCSGPPRPRGLSRRPNSRTLGSSAVERQAGRSARHLPDGAANREGRGHSETHQPALAAPRRNH